MYLACAAFCAGVLILPVFPSGAGAGAGAGGVVMALGGAGTELLEAAGMALLGGVGVMAAVGSGCSGRCCASFFTSLSSNSEKEGLGDRSPPSGVCAGVR